MQATDLALPALRAPVAGDGQASLKAAARQLEAAFLAELLKQAGLGETPSEFGGGIGEDQFASYLREAQAGAMAEAGGIGLAEQIFRSLARGA